MNPALCPFCHRVNTEESVPLPFGLFAHATCLRGESPEARMMEEVLAALRRMRYGEITVKVHQGQPKHITTTESRSITG